MKKCPKCGFESEEKFCSKCGARMEEAVVSVEEPAKVVVVPSATVANAPKETFLKSKKGKGLIFLVAIVLIIGSIYFITEKNKKQELCSKAEAVMNEYGFTDAYAGVTGKKSGIYECIIRAKGFGDLSYETMIKLDASMPAGGIYIYADNATIYEVYSSTGSIYRNSQQVYPSDEDGISSDNDADDYSRPSVSTGERNALSSAKSYLAMSGFSEKSLRDQLEYEGYLEGEIDYAIEHCNADWELECEESAKAYLDSSSLSKEGLIGQLEYEGFDSELAKKVADRVY